MKDSNVTTGEQPGHRQVLEEVQEWQLLLLLLP